MISTYTYTQTYRINSVTGEERRPGELVSHRWWPQSLGIIIGVLDDCIVVMWSRTRETMMALDRELEAVGRTL